MYVSDRDPRWAIVVATVSSIPSETMSKGSVTYRQVQVTGAGAGE